ncbi:hypothetical protein AB837_00292 [bacterium AB1]|nr:hypothetical protein AB837_00292 [bacterium AB1]
MNHGDKHNKNDLNINNIFLLSSHMLNLLFYKTNSNVIYGVLKQVDHYKLLCIYYRLDMQNQKKFNLFKNLKKQILFYESKYEFLGVMDKVLIFNENYNKTIIEYKKIIGSYLNKEYYVNNLIIFQKDGMFTGIVYLYDLIVKEKTINHILDLKKNILCLYIPKKINENYLKYKQVDKIINIQDVIILDEDNCIIGLCPIDDILGDFDLYKYNKKLYLYHKYDIWHMIYLFIANIFGCIISCILINMLTFDNFLIMSSIVVRCINDTIIFISVEDKLDPHIQKQYMPLIIFSIAYFIYILFSFIYNLHIGILCFLSIIIVSFSVLFLCNIIKKYNVRYGFLYIIILPEILVIFIMSGLSKLLKYLIS